jgi:hypothetical protein
MSQGEDELSVENSVQDDCRLLKNRGFSLSVHFYIILPATLYAAQGVDQQYSGDNLTRGRKGSGQNDELVEEPVTRTPPH